MRTLYKNPNSTRTVQTRPVGPTGQTGRPQQVPNLAVNICPLLFGEFHKPKSKNYPDIHVLHRAYKFKNKTKGDI